MKHKIELQEWNHTCGDGCCYTYGTDIIIDGVKIENEDGTSPHQLLEVVLKHFKIDATVEHIE